MSVQSFYDGVVNANKVFGKQLKDKPQFDVCDLSIFEAATWEAYLDAARTFKGIGTGVAQKACKSLAAQLQSYFNGKAAQSEPNYDKMHDEWCNLFINELKMNGYTATYGQAQKVVNMTFKYLYCMYAVKGNVQNKNYAPWFEYCHIALDSFTLEWIWRNCDTSNYTKYEAWSTLGKGDKQKSKKHMVAGYKTIVGFYRKIFPHQNYPGCTPFLAEFIFWEEIQIELATEEFYFARWGAGLSAKAKENFRNKPLSVKGLEIKNLLP